MVNLYEIYYKKTHTLNQNKMNIPKDWKKKKLEDFIIEMKSGLSRKLSSSDTGLPVLRSNNLTDNGIDFNDLKYWYVDDPQGSDTSSYILKDKDLLLNFINSIAQIGKCSIFKNKIGRDVIYTTNMLRIRLNDNLNVEYFYYLTNTNYYRQFILSVTNPAVNQASFTTKSLKKFPILLPPLPEQQKIAEILSTWDKAIETTTKLIQAKKTQKKALMQRLLNDDYLLKKGGKRVKLESLGTTFNGLSGKTAKDFGKGKPFITYLNIFRNSSISPHQVNFVNINKKEKQIKVKYGDLFFTTSSETPEEVGMTSVLLFNPEDMYLNSFCFGFRLDNFSKLIPVFAKYYFRTINVRIKISRLAQGSTRFNISKKQVIKIQLTLPPLAEQTRIAEILTTADKEIETLEKYLSKLQEQKKGLMQQLLTGKKRVSI